MGILNQEQQTLCAFHSNPQLFGARKSVEVVSHQCKFHLKPIASTTAIAFHSVIACSAAIAHFQCSICVHYHH